MANAMTWCMRRNHAAWCSPDSLDWASQALMREVSAVAEYDAEIDADSGEANIVDLDSADLKHFKWVSQMFKNSMHSLEVAKKTPVSRRAVSPAAPPLSPGLVSDEKTTLQEGPFFSKTMQPAGMSCYSPAPKP